MYVAARGESLCGDGEGAIGVVGGVDGRFAGQ